MYDKKAQVSAHRAAFVLSSIVDRNLSCRPSGRIAQSDDDVQIVAVDLQPMVSSRTIRRN